MLARSASSAIASSKAELEIDEQRIYLTKVAALLSPSILGVAPPKPATTSKQPKSKKKLFGSIKSTRQSQSARLRKLHSSFSSSRRSQATICKELGLGLIDKIEDFCDDTLVEYVDFFKTAILPGNVAKLAMIAGVSSPTQLRLPDAELQALLDELPARNP